MTRKRAPKVVALSGGVGGAKLVHGLAEVLPPETLTVVVNTGDDFRHWGLYVSPDVDTVLYTLAGLAPAERGWGISGDTFHALEMMRRYGQPGWFQIGDQDLATHLHRTRALAAGETLTSVTAAQRMSLGVGPRILPMSDLPRPTEVRTDAGWVGFQHWLVEARGEPEVREITFRGEPEPAPAVMSALRKADLVVICPSNPYVSVDPILSLRGVRALVRERTTVAVSPIVAGKAVKGPLATMAQQLTHKPASVQTIAKHYAGLLNGLVVQRGDAHNIDVPVKATDIVMRSVADRITLAREVLAFAQELR